MYSPRNSSDSCFTHSSKSESWPPNAKQNSWTIFWTENSWTVLALGYFAFSLSALSLARWTFLTFHSGNSWPSKGTAGALIWPCQNSKMPVFSACSNDVLLTCNEKLNHVIGACAPAAASWGQLVFTWHVMKDWGIGLNQKRNITKTISCLVPSSGWRRRWHGRCSQCLVYWCIKNHAEHDISKPWFKESLWESDFLFRCMLLQQSRRSWILPNSHGMTDWGSSLNEKNQRCLGQRRCARGARHRRILPASLYQLVLLIIT